MADYKDLPGGRQDPVRSHDEGDGTFSRATASHLRGWDATDGAWYRIPLDHTTGALLTAGGGSSGGLTNAELRASPVPVSGTFWQATQPVSGPVTDAQLRASAVPVSLGSVPTHAVTDGGGSLTVDGTFWQATQPVSGPLTDAQLRASAVPVSGTVTANQGGTWTVQPGNTANTTPWLVKSAIDNATQNVLVSWEEMAGTAAAESALTNATFRTENYVALGAATSYTVPSGKRLRITSVSCYVKATSTVNNLARFRLRAVASGSVLNTSPPVFDVVLALDAPGTIAAGLAKEEAYAIPEGSLDFAAGAQLAFTWFTAANTCTVGLSFVGYLYTP